MGVKITKHDIGAEIISILTKGMYPDPRDAMREYVQNGVDADAKNIIIKVRGDSIVIEDDGHGMNEETMRKSIRLGISDKNPKIDVGFRGIGIYSSFHLCNILYIYSLQKGEDKPHKISFNFKDMRNILKQQQEGRLKGKLTGDQLIDLQSILQMHISIEELKPEDYPTAGTRIEMVGLDPNFFNTLTKFNEMADYLRDVVPLHFNEKKFTWAKEIEKKILEKCEQNNAEFKFVNLTLQVNTETEVLYRPYYDDKFDGEPLKPLFKEIKNRGHFLGVAWGCLNPTRHKISDRDLRGFLIKKQGFSIGNRASILKYFRRATYFDRYIGEIIVVHKELLPNAPRTDFEISPLRVLFYDALSDIASFYNEKANEHQEFTKGDEKLDDAVSTLKTINKNITFYSDNTEQLINIIVQVREIQDDIDARLEKKVIRSERIEEAQKVVSSAKTLEREVQQFIDRARKGEAVKEKGKTPEARVKERLKKLPTTTKGTSPAQRSGSLVEILENVDLPMTSQLKAIFELIDERFIQAVSTNKADYISTLIDLQEEIEDILSGE